jgi:hypothetical protein
MQAGETKRIAVPQVQVTETGRAEPHGIRQQGIEHRLQLAGRARDDAQHL